MSTMLEFGFVPGGGFALGDHKSFDRVVPHLFIHLRRLLPHNYHISAEENWPTLTIAITARRLSRRVISIVLAASPAHRASHKPLYKVVIPATVVVVTSASKSTHKTSSK
ncbi:hypothetical protein ACLOJK_034912, partial [Asimina triloba]